ncbi:MAG: Tfp pilus assembly protein FimT/FimU [Chthoniobacteraceae bacterium]
MKFPHYHRNAYSLLELLIVVGIIATLLSASIPALNRSANVNRAAGEIPQLLESARTYAMAHNTYVWVGFYLDSTNQRLSIGTVAGNTGQSDDLSASTYSPLAKVRTFDQFTLKRINGLSGMATNGDNIIDSKIGSFVNTAAGTSITFTQIIQYSPQGVASVLLDSSSHWIQIGLTPSNSANTTNVAVFQVATLTGQVQVFRP